MPMAQGLGVCAKAAVVPASDAAAKAGSVNNRRICFI